VDVKKKEDENKKGLLGRLFKKKSGGCCDVKFVPVLKEEQQKNSDQDKK